MSGVQGITDVERHAQFPTDGAWRPPSGACRLTIVVRHKNDQSYERHHRARVYPTVCLFTAWAGVDQREEPEEKLDPTKHIADRAHFGRSGFSVLLIEL